MPETRIALAAVAGAHGVGGEVRLKLFTESIDSLKRHSAVRVGERAFVMSGVRQSGAGAIARLGGVGSREEAEALRGQLVTVERSELPPLGEGEYYHADLIGLACVSEDGQALGTVAAVENFGAGDILEIEQTEGGRALVPFRAPAAELRDGRVVVDPVFLS